MKIESDLHGNMQSASEVIPKETSEFRDIS
jgi:hypothetical protein